MNQARARRIKSYGDRQSRFTGNHWGPRPAELGSLAARSNCYKQAIH
jgi:hypothetical protein